jgi:ATP phosphoribosyltransferase regulatory subunit
MFHTPDGFRDIYGEECLKKMNLMEKLHRVFVSYGYEDIETPTVEYFDVFGSDVGTTPSRDLYKFFDRDGNTLVLRPDFTPSIARAASMYFEDRKRPLRLCYQGSTFANSSDLQGRLKETTQMGVEMLGDSSAEADAEILSLTIDLLKKAGLKSFQVSVGEVDFFKSLAEDSGLPEEEIEQIRQLISNKNFFGVQELLDRTKLSAAKKNAFVNLPQLFGGAEVLDAAEKLALTRRAKEAIARLRDIYSILAEKGSENYISFDFGSLSKYKYYTGIIFSAFTYGSGEPVAKGGRYDSLLAHFGKDEPAVGVGLYFDQLMAVKSRTARRRTDR